MEAPTAPPLPTLTATATPCGIEPPGWGDRSGWVQYTIQPGDSPLSLAYDTGTTLAAILQANCLPTFDSIRPGVTLFLPRPLPSQPIGSIPR